MPAHSLNIASFLPPGRALVAEWDSREAALAAFRGPLATAVRGGGRFSLDGEVAKISRDTLWHLALLESVRRGKREDVPR